MAAKSKDRDGLAGLLMFPFVMLILFLRIALLPLTLLFGGLPYFLTGAAGGFVHGIRKWMKEI